MTNNYAYMLINHDSAIHSPDLHKLSSNCQLDSWSPSNRLKAWQEKSFQEMPNSTQRGLCSSS